MSPLPLLLVASLAADTIVVGKIWTVDPARPFAEAVAIEGDRIVAVGSEEEIRRLAREGTKILEFPGALVLPGFNDSHVHLSSAGRLLLGANLLDANVPETFAHRLGEAAARLPKGSWITGGDWGAYAQWRKGSAGDEKGEPLLRPHRSHVDPVTREHPVFVRSFDGSLHFANALALRAAGIGKEARDPEGGRIERARETGEPTGLLEGAAADLVRDVVPEPSWERRVAETRRALDDARRAGVTSLQDMSPPPQLAIYQHLLDRGELTVRVHYRPTLDKVDALATLGIRRGFGTEWIRLGCLKGFVDGIMGNSTALFEEPYANQPDNHGRLRDMMHPEGNMERLLFAAEDAGLQVSVHAIGDAANALLLDLLEKIERERGPADRRFRIVHAQVVRPEDFQRFGRLRAIAEVQPYHCTDDMRWMEERIGAERCANAYAFRRLKDAGAVLSFGSDWPGTNASWYPIDAVLGLYAAVTRQTLEGEPADGWFPAERLTLEEAIEAYTLGPAISSYEESLKGSIAPGKLADLVVLDRDLFEVSPRSWPDAKVLLTMVGGRVVYRAGE